jgi:hypothetical protein
MAAVATPFDASMAELSGKLEGTGLAYGGAFARLGAAADGALASSVRGMAAAPAAAERAVFKSRVGFSSASDLAEAVAENRVQLKDVKEDELPDELKSLPAARRQAKLNETLSRRCDLKSRLDDLARKREAWLKANAGTRRADSFDARLVASLKQEAARKGIAY